MSRHETTSYRYRTHFVLHRSREQVRAFAEEAFEALPFRGAVFPMAFLGEELAHAAISATQQNQHTYDAQEDESPFRN